MDAHGTPTLKSMQTIASRGRALAALASLLLPLACGSDPSQPSVLVHIDTDAPLRFVDRLRVEVYQDGELDPEDEHDFDREGYEPTPDEDPPDEAEPQPADKITSLPLTIELKPAAPISDLPEVLVRVRGFARRQLIPAEEARFEAPLPRSGPDLCVAEGPALGVGSTVDLATDAGDRPNTEGWSCAGKTPEVLQPVGLRFKEAGPHLLSARNDQVVLFAISRCGTSQPRFRCSTGSLRFSVDEADLRNPPVVLAGSVGNQPVSGQLKLERTDQLPDANPGAAQTPSTDGPTTEPAPEVTIDRVAWIDMAEGSGALNLTLHASCFGIRADLDGKRSCVDGSELIDLPRETPASVIDAIPVPEWAAALSRGCTSSPPRDNAVCVPGGAFVLGESGENGVALADADRATPERIVTVDPFYLDTREYSVQRLANANSLQGIRFAPDEGSPEGDVSDACRIPALPDQHADNGALPLTCVNWAAARALCQAAGGDLPTSVQWEYAAATAGRDGAETSYPWGNRARRFASRLGPNPSSASEVGEGNDMDCTPADSPICDLATNVSEWTLDSHDALSSECWRGASATNPTCIDNSTPIKTVKGGSWRNLDEHATRAAARRG